MESIVIRYRFDIEDGTIVDFDVALDPKSLLISPPEQPLPDWTRLEFKQCPNCPLDPAEHPYCPAAAQLPRLVQAFDHLFSYSQAKVEVTTEQRTVVTTTSIQQGVGALMGLIIATSGCPFTSFFRPMARFHLPFASQDETSYRAVCAFVLADYFRARESGEPQHTKLEDLTELYNELHKLNSALANRIRAATQTDSSVNALIVLDMLTVILPMEVDAQLPEVFAYFQPYLEWSKSRE